MWRTRFASIFAYNHALVFRIPAVLLSFKEIAREPQNVELRNGGLSK
ncbi:MAG: hypothetical protein ACOX38_09465 [Bacillota bacterium]